MLTIFFFSISKNVHLDINIEILFIYLFFIDFSLYSIKDFKLIMNEKFLLITKILHICIETCQELQSIVNSFNFKDHRNKTYRFILT